MALHILRTKLISERILPRLLVKGLPPLQGRAKTDPLVETFGCPPGAKSPLYNVVAYSLFSPGKAQSGSVSFRGRRNFGSGPLTENIPKMNSYKKSSNAPRTEKQFVSNGQCKYDCSRREINEIVYYAQVWGLGMACLTTAFGFYNVAQLNGTQKALDGVHRRHRSA